MSAAAFELQDQLGEIVIDNPPLNLFSEGLVDLRTAAEQAAASEARAVLLRAEGDAFSAGAGISIFTGLDEAEAGTQIGQVEAVIGAFPFAGGTQCLASRVGAARTAQLAAGPTLAHRATRHVRPRHLRQPLKGVA
jgi:enoyl-CoA hydratase/carnithine racemase